MKQLKLIVLVLSLLLMNPIIAWSNNKLILNCTHIQVCNSLKFLTDNQPGFLVEQSIDHQGQDPHHFEPKVGDIKKLIQSQNLVLAPNKIQPWLKAIKTKRSFAKPNGKITIQAKSSSEHFWLKLDSLCDYLKNLNNFLQKDIQNYQNQEEKIKKQCKQLSETLISKKSKSTGTIILLHDSLTNFFKNRGHEVITLRGHGHHQKITTKSIKKLKKETSGNKKIIWIIETQIPYPTSLKKMIKSNHQVIEMDTLGKFGTEPWGILTEVTKRLNQ